MPTRRTASASVPRKRTSDEADNDVAPTVLNGRTAASRRRVVQDSDSSSEEEQEEVEEEEDDDDEEEQEKEEADEEEEQEEQEYESADEEEQEEEEDEDEKLITNKERKQHHNPAYNDQEDDEEDDEDEADETIIERDLLVEDDSEEQQAPSTPERPTRRARVVSAAVSQQASSSATHSPNVPRVKQETSDHTLLDGAEPSSALPSSSSSYTPQTPVRKAASVPVSQIATPSAATAAPASATAATPRTPANGRAQTVMTPATLTAKTPTQNGAATVGPPKTRLIIHKMVLRNFKSYAGEQIIGPFHKSFSAVVGPNGSGKSNVIDAMLFVFGWRANKMRQGKLSELIHNSAGSESIGSCTVEVHFRDILDLPGEDYTLVPNSKLVVSRTAYRNNSSVYAMNGKKSSFTEVTTLLRDRGIDLDHKRFLILQGEVESIAQMPPKAKNEHEEGLLEYLEDIIGTSSYKTPIEEANKKVDELNEVRGERLSRLKIVQKEKDSLESKKQEAEGYLRDQNELTMRQSTLYQIYMLECNDEVKIATASIEKLKTRIQEEVERNAGSKAEMEALEQEYKSATSDYDKLVKENDKLVKDLAKLEKDDVQLQEQRKHLETKKKKLAKSINDEKHASSEARATLSNATEEIESHAREVAKLEDSLEKEEGELEKVRESLKGKTQGFSEAIEKKQKELQPWSAKRSEKQNQRNVALEEKRLIEDRFGQAENEAREAKEALEALESANEGKHEETERLKDEKTQQDKKVRQYRDELHGMEAQEAQLRNKASASRSKCEEARASVQSNQSRGEVLNSLARQADLGMIKGFLGRLGNLGVIDEKYDVAISTACPGLDNIVVEGVETGQACIEHLRRNNLGRAIFILLNSLTKMNLGPINTPESVPRLFDLVQPKDARYSPAFYHQLRDTLVARDLAQANRIAYGAQRWRVVTLDGQLIDKSGTMSGGGTRVARGAMSSKAFAQDYTLEQISRLDRERQVDQETLNSHIKSTSEMKALLDNALARVPQIDIELEKVELDIATGAKMIREASKRVQELRSSSGPDASDVKRVEELDNTIAAFDEELESLNERCSSIEADIAALQEKILEAGGVGLRAQKSKVDGIKERLELFSERITKAEVAKSKADKDLVKYSKNGDKNAEALQALENELSDVLDALSNKTQRVSEARSKADESQFAVEAKQEAKDEIKARLDKCTEGINAFRALEMESKQKLEDNEKSLSDNSKRLRHWQEKHDKLELHRIDSDIDDVDVNTSVAQAPVKGNADADDGEKTADVSTSQDKNSEKAADESQSRMLELQEYSPDELRAMSKETIKGEIVIYEEKLQKGSANLSVLEEYRRRENEFLARAHDLEQTTQERDHAKEVHDNLRKERLESFMAGFSVISAKLKEMYQTITLGGNAELELVDSLDPFSEGILFSVMPPKKSWKNISNLSGGEKTLSSLALVFALHAFKPTPLYAMDELDAALDFRNVSIVANLIKERTKGAQFIVISLRNNMFELASRLVGIYKTSGQTKSLAVHNTDLHAPLPIAATTRQASVPRGSQPLATPRMSVPRSLAPTPGMGVYGAGAGVGSRYGSIPPSSTSQRLTGPVPPFTVRKSQTNGALNSMGPPLSTPARFNIPQTPRTGNIKGLGMMSTSKSSIKLTSSQSVRGGLSGTTLANVTPQPFERGASQGIHATPLATRRPN